MLFALALIAAVTPAGFAQCNTQLFNNSNGSAVLNNPTNPTYFSTSRPVYVGQIWTYHWNGGQGDRGPGTVLLRNVATNQVYGPYAVTVSGSRSQDWNAFPQAVLPPGNYQVIDSRPATWSHNVQSSLRGFTRIWGAVLTGALLFDDSNVNGVINSPRNPTQFTLNRSTVITQIWTYHWNGGQGDRGPGSIRLLDVSTNRSYGPYPVTVSGGRFQDWNAYPNVILPAGVYRILDSRPSTWSHNVQSGYRGFARVWGTTQCIPQPPKQRRCPPWSAGGTQMHVVVVDQTGDDILIVDNNAAWTGPAPTPGTRIGTDVNPAVGFINFNATAAGNTINAQARDIQFGAGRQLTLTNCRTTRISGSTPLLVCLGSRQFNPLPPLLGRVWLLGFTTGGGATSVRMTGRIPGLAPLTAASTRPLFSVFSNFVVTPAGVTKLELDVDFSIQRQNTSINLPLSAKVIVSDRAHFPDAGIIGTGTPTPGSRMTFHLDSPQDAGMRYQVLSSLGTGPIPINNRLLNLSPDGLFFASVLNLISPHYTGVLDANGRGTGMLDIPPLAVLKGLTVHTAFVTIDPKLPAGVKSVSNTFPFLID